MTSIDADDPFTVPGYVCPYCGTDCSPIAEAPCGHFLAVDGENGWRLSATAREIRSTADARHPTLFRDLLYHDADCRAGLLLRRAEYDGSLEIYVFSRDAEATRAAFLRAMDKE